MVTTYLEHLQDWPCSELYGWDIMFSLHTVLYCVYRVVVCIKRCILDQQQSLSGTKWREYFSHWFFFRNKFICSSTSQV